MGYCIYIRGDIYITHTQDPPAENQPPPPPQFQHNTHTHPFINSPSRPVTTSPTVFGIGLAYDPETRKRKLTPSLAARVRVCLCCVCM